MLDKSFNIVKNSKDDGYQCGIPSIVYRFFVKKKSFGGANTPAQSETLPTRDKSAIKSEGPNQEF